MLKHQSLDAEASKLDQNCLLRIITNKVEINDTQSRKSVSLLTLLTYIFVVVYSNQKSLFVNVHEPLSTPLCNIVDALTKLNRNLWFPPTRVLTTVVCVKYS